jgi:hypothetical protein
MSAAPPAPAAQAVYLLPLTDSGAPDVPGTYIYLPPPPKDTGYILRFQIEGCSSICRQGSLWVNIPAKGHNFTRSHYQEYKSVLCLILRWPSPLHLLTMSQTKARLQRLHGDRHSHSRGQCLLLLHDIFSPSRMVLHDCGPDAAHAHTHLLC